MSAVVRGDPGVSSRGSQHSFPAFASPMHVSVQYSDSGKASLEEQREAYPDICFALDGSRELAPKVSSAWGLLQLQKAALVSARFAGSPTEPKPFVAGSADGCSAASSAGLALPCLALPDLTPSSLADTCTDSAECHLCADAAKPRLGVFGPAAGCGRPGTATLRNLQLAWTCVPNKQDSQQYTLILDLIQDHAGAARPRLGIRSPAAGCRRPCTAASGTQPCKPPCRCCKAALCHRGPVSLQTSAQV